MLRFFWWGLLAVLTISCKEKEHRDPIPSTTKIQPTTENSFDTLNKLIKLEYPASGQLITSPLEITGEARGYWFFEATAPLELLDGNLDKISETYITAIGEWMTTEWVPFSGSISFEKPATENGYLILHKANASGLKEHDRSDTIPIKFGINN